jgi:aspartyl-tRNA(Asn)/glutamyl-tRNA(Gln) amidotransferase subunit A
MRSLARYHTADLFPSSAFDNYFLQAQRVRQLVKDDFNSIFLTHDFHSPSNSPVQHKNDNRVDVLVHPSAIRTAPLLSEKSGLGAYVQDVLTVPASLAGLPALSVPVPAICRGFPGERGEGSADNEDDGWPVGASVVGQWGCDELVLKVGEIIEGIDG